MADDTKHEVNILACFLLLLLFTAAEIVLYEVWRRSNATGDPFVPKFVLVLIIFAFTLPKAFIVMTYFMHLKFERVTIVGIALAPLVLVAIMILPVLTDIRTLAERNYTKDHTLADFKAPPDKAAHGNSGAAGHHEGAEAADDEQEH